MIINKIKIKEEIEIIIKELIKGIIGIYIFKKERMCIKREDIISRIIREEKEYIEIEMIIKLYKKHKVRIRIDRERKKEGIKIKNISVGERYIYNYPFEYIENKAKRLKLYVYK